MADIAILGDINLDWYVGNNLSIAFTDLGENGVIEWQAIEEKVGGTGLNFAKFAKELGYRPVLFGKIGDDSAGNAILDWLNVNGIDAAVTKDKLFPTGKSIIAFDKKNIRLLIDNSPNANSYLTLQDVQNYADIITNISILYVSGYSLSRRDSTQSQATLWTINWAKQNRTPQIIFDVVPHQIYKIYDYNEFLRMTEGVNILVSEVATMRRFLGMGTPKEKISRAMAKQTIEKLANTYDRCILRYGPSGIDVQVIWDGPKGLLTFEETGHHDERDKRGYGDKLVLRVLKEIFNLGPATGCG